MKYLAGLSLLLILFLPSFSSAQDYAVLQAASVRVDVEGGCGSGVLVTRQVGDVTRTYVWTAGHVAEVLRNPDGTFREAVIYQEIRENRRLELMTMGEITGGIDWESGVTHCTPAATELRREEATPVQRS